MLAVENECATGTWGYFLIIVGYYLRTLVILGYLQVLNKGFLKL
jgi:hypothetical protein